MRFKDGMACFLSDYFYKAYPASKFPEIGRKHNRPHVLYLIEVERDQWFAIPLRSNIAHEFKFETVGNGGLDYSKAIPVLDAAFVDDRRTAYVRKDDWPLIRSGRVNVKLGMRHYRAAKQNPDRPGNANVLRYSTLQYFERELGLDDSNA